MYDVWTQCIVGCFPSRRDTCTKPDSFNKAADKEGDDIERSSPDHLIGVQDGADCKDGADDGCGDGGGFIMVRPILVGVRHGC